jgi:hypothetical protein
MGTTREFAGGEVLAINFPLAGVSEKTVVSGCYPDISHIMIFVLDGWFCSCLDANVLLTRRIIIRIDICHGAYNKEDDTYLYHCFHILSLAMVFFNIYNDILYNENSGLSSKKRVMVKSRIFLTEKENNDRKNGDGND